jgi:subtilisin family serine protease
MRALKAAILQLALFLVVSALAQAAAPTLMPPQARAEPERYLVVTVANPQSIRPGAVGGTMRGYQGGGTYRASRAAAAAVERLIERYRLTLASEWPIEQLQVHCIVFRIAEDAVRDEVVIQLQANDDVLIAQPLNEFAPSSSAYDDPYAKLQENVRALEVREAHLISRGQGIRVAVIDTGIDSEHPDLAGRVEIAGNYVDDDLVALRNDRHGTQVAGLIAAVANNGIGIVGVAPEVKLLGFKACWHDSTDNAGRCNSFTLAQALAGALDARAQIINLSLTGPADPLLTALVDKALSAGVIVVGAAGRDVDSKSFPAGLEHVLAVAESEADVSGARLLRAPGKDIVTLMPRGRYDFASGSSLATAQVTGVVALLLERNRRLSAADLFKILQASSGERQTPNGALTSINACTALSSLVPKASCATSSGQ